MARDTRIVVVGAGQAGGFFAQSLRKFGYSGPVTMLGREQYLPYERPPLSKDFLASAVKLESVLMQPASFYEANNIALRLRADVVKIDRGVKQVLLGSSEVVGYDFLVLTTGARARHLTGIDGPRVFYLRDLGDALGLREALVPGCRLVVIGAGFIGLEVAATARTLECSVIVVEAGPAPLGRVVPADIGTFMAEVHRQHGVEFRMPASVARLEYWKNGRGVDVVLSSSERLPAHVVVVGVGVVPDTGLASESGLAVNDGVLVDYAGRTSDPWIYAAGDSARQITPLYEAHLRLEAWQNAKDQATRVARALTASDLQRIDVPWFWTNQYDINLQIAGFTTEWDGSVMRGSLASRSFALFKLQRGRLVAALGVNKQRDMKAAQELVRRRTMLPPRSLSDESLDLRNLA